ncbi:hypothetical protein U14_03777 [Candidatus Moduliflexus flocculans]|uniref:AB hydrolase-1 domain-containing protein n=1 Tax=Candidatus Moduliflexus flocculans TaxID=1499966 RepID=A0A081BQ60_9BACT|nr:hypothetical protein U14_03777 [Candidatus Moduliflexus flocculans]
MEIKKQTISANGVEIPAILMNPRSEVSAIVMHGYGGNKEEILGLSGYLAFMDIETVTIDLRGHGESAAEYSCKMLDDLNALIKHLNKQTVITIGHSLGGRLALLADAAYKVGISPALGQTYSEQTQTAIKNFRSYRVKETSPETNFQILAKLPMASITRENSFILYGSRDVPEIQRDCLELEQQGMNVARINQALHHDIYTLPETLAAIGKFIRDIRETNKEK